MNIDSILVLISPLTFGVSEFGVARQSAVSAVRFVAGQATLSRPDERFPIAVRLREIVHVAYLQNLVAFRVGNVQRAVQRADRHVVPVRHFGHAEKST